MAVPLSVFRKRGFTKQKSELPQLVPGFLTLDQGMVAMPHTDVPSKDNASIKDFSVPACLSLEIRALAASHRLQRCRILCALLQDFCKSYLKKFKANRCCVCIPLSNHIIKPKCWRRPISFRV